MYSSGWVYPETAVLIGLFSLGWFLAGLLVGRRWGRPNGGDRRPQPQKNRDRDRDRDRERGAPRAAAKGDRVEIYVGNLSYEMSEKDLAAMFEEYGRVISARLIENRFSGKSKGFGFVEMPDHDEAMAAIKALEGKEYRGRKLVVNEARSRARG